MMSPKSAIVLRALATLIAGPIIVYCAYLLYREAQEGADGLFVVLALIVMYLIAYTLERVSKLVRIFWDTESCFLLPAPVLRSWDLAH